MKSKLIFIFSLFLFLNLIHVRGENNVQKATFIYAVKGNDTLRLDKYHIANEKVKPCVIFVFGGGFSTGKRDKAYYLPYYHFLVKNGYSVVAIDYRLGLKGIGEQKDMTAKKFISVFENTIYMAVEDLYDATNYVLENADVWKIDKKMIITSGSSAGAITVLQGEYERCNESEISKRLPRDFGYAGVIAFAGAIYSNERGLKWKNTPAPVQLFHGDADMNVPFDKIGFSKYGFYGSKHIAKQFDDNKFPYYFYLAENVNHSLAVTPMQSNLEEIKSFLDKYVTLKQSLKTNMVVVPLDKPVAKKKFKIKEYIKANLGE